MFARLAFGKIDHCGAFGEGSMMRRMIAILLCTLLLCAWGSSAMAAFSREDWYAMGISALQDMTPESAEMAVDYFEAAGNYEHAKRYKQYAQCLSEIYTMGSDTAADLTMTKYRLQDLVQFSGFGESLKEQNLPSCTELLIYIEAREQEQDKHYYQAWRSYLMINDVLDALDRRYEMTPLAYEEGKALYDAEDYAAAAEILRNLNWADSETLYHTALAQLQPTPTPAPQASAVIPLQDIPTPFPAVPMTVEVSEPGFKDEPVTTYITIDDAGTIQSIVVDASTQALGMRCEDPAFTDQFIGLSNPVSIGKEIDVVSGATQTSEAVVNGVNSLFAVIREKQASAATIAETLILTVDPTVGHNHLSWNLLQGAESYEIMRHMTQTTYNTLASVVNAEYDDANVRQGYRYYYTVVAHFPDESTLESNEVELIASRQGTATSTPKPITIDFPVMTRTVTIYCYSHGKLIATRYQTCYPGKNTIDAPEIDGYKLMDFPYSKVVTLYEDGTLSEDSVSFLMYGGVATVTYQPSSQP